MAETLIILLSNSPRQLKLVYLSISFFFDLELFNSFDPLLIAAFAFHETKDFFFGLFFL